MKNIPEDVFTRRCHITYGIIMHWKVLEQLRVMVYCDRLAREMSDGGSE
jgi:hypothetical protein